MDTRKIKLLKPHTHAGTEYQIGDEIELSKEQAEWLINTYVAERVQARKQYEKVFGQKSSDSNSDEVKE